jgi:hypothetical protein
MYSARSVARPIEAGWPAASNRPDQAFGGGLTVTDRETFPDHARLAPQQIIVREQQGGHVTAD